MTKPTPHGQVPEALQLADEISKAGAFPAYPRAPYEAAAAELRRQHAQVTALTAAPGVQPLSDGKIASACMSYRHDFGLLEPDERAKIMFTAREWERAFSKEREWTAPAQPAEGAANVAKPAEIEHVAGDVLKNGAESNMSTQPVAQQEAPAGELEEVLRERDDAEDFINELLDEVLGADRPEWSSAYNRYDAMNDVRERITALHKPAVDKAWGRFESAMAAPQPCGSCGARNQRLPDGGLPCGH